MTSKRECYLLNLDTNERINLTDKTPVILGRNRETVITDLKVSKQQIACYFNVEESKVKLKVVGRAVSGCNGLALRNNLVYTLDHGDIIEVRIGCHKFEVNLEPDPTKVEEFKPKRPKLDNISSNANMIKENSHCEKKHNLDNTWENIDNKQLLIYSTGNCKGRSKIAAFDIDGTIIKTKSGARFPKTMDDWMWNINDVQTQLKKLFEQDYKIVFFTNQSGVGNDTTKIKDFKTKIENVVAALKLPIQVFISLGKQHYRKPRTGMWDILVSDKNNGVIVNVDESFYVGDAAGREKNWAPKRNKDHSACDRLFALNIGLRFYTPEEYFLQHSPAPYKMPEFDPRIDTSNLAYPDVSYDKLNVVLMVGGPGSGKSSFVKENLLRKGYIHVSRDKLGSWQKCVKDMEQALGQNKNVVIDNTNVDKATRQRFIQSARKYNADVRCFIMNTTLAQMRHNNKFREMTDKTHVPVSDIIIFSYRKNYQEPEISEGYSQILHLPFITQFNDKSQEKLYRTFLLE